MGGAGNLRRDPQPKQQDRFDQHAEHRFTTAADGGERTAGIQAGNGEEEAGDGEQIDKRNQVAQPRQR
mgnify:CR=1 FL=1